MVSSNNSTRNISSNLNYRSWRDSGLLLPSVFGLIYITVLLAIALFLPEPTPTQYSIFTAVLALSGGAISAVFAGEVKLHMPFMKNSVVRATTGLLVFLILFFFSPVGLLVDQPKVEAKEFVDVFVSPATGENIASRELDARMRLDDIQEKFQETAEPSEEALDKLDRSIRQALSEKETQEQFETVLRFFKRSAVCAINSSCDHGIMCENFFDEIDKFRNFYCGIIDDRDRLDNDNTAKTFEKFATDTCRINFIEKYINFEQRDYSNICIPTQCWATHKSPPYPCDGSATGGTY